MLQMCLKAFRLQEQNVVEIKALRAALAQIFSNLSLLLNDAKIEINYGYLSSKDCIAISKSMKRLIQHLGSLSSVNFNTESTGSHSNEIKELLHSLSGFTKKFSVISFERLC
jgi:hypothetical protein